MSEDYDDSIDSFKDVLHELDKEKTKVIISKDTRRFNKPVTIVKGLENRRDVKSITKDLKIKLGTGGSYKENQIILQGDHRDATRELLMSKGIKEESIEVI